MKTFNILLFSLLIYCTANAQSTPPAKGVDFFAGKWYLLAKGLPQGDVKIILTVDELNALGGLKKFEEGMEKAQEKTVSLKSELRQLKDQLGKLEEGTEQYNIIAQKAGLVSDKIADMLRSKFFSFGIGT